MDFTTIFTSQIKSDRGACEIIIVMAAQAAAAEVQPPEPDARWSICRKTAFCCCDACYEYGYGNSPPTPAAGVSSQPGEKFEKTDMERDAHAQHADEHDMSHVSAESSGTSEPSSSSQRPMPAVQPALPLPPQLWPPVPPPPVLPPMWIPIMRPPPGKPPVPPPLQAVQALSSPIMAKQLQLSVDELLVMSYNILGGAARSAPVAAPCATDATVAAPVAAVAAPESLTMTVEELNAYAMPPGMRVAADNVPVPVQPQQFLATRPKAKPKSKKMPRRDDVIIIDAADAASVSRVVPAGTAADPATASASPLTPPGLTSPAPERQRRALSPEPPRFPPSCALLARGGEGTNRRAPPRIKVEARPTVSAAQISMPASAPGTAAKVVPLGTAEEPSVVTFV